MRFCDLFISYKIGLKGLKNTIPLTKLPLYRKICAIAILFCGILGAILQILGYPTWFYILGGFCALIVIVFLIIDSSKKNLELMLKDHYKPYSEGRMNMVIAILEAHSIDIKNIESLDRLIEEAQYEQQHSDYLAPLKKPLKTLRAIIVPIIIFLAEKIGDAASISEAATIAASSITLILLIVSLTYLLATPLKKILYQDYDKYNEFISDVRQIKLFSPNSTSTSNIHLNPTKNQ